MRSTPVPVSPEQSRTGTASPEATSCANVRSSSSADGSLPVEVCLELRVVVRRRSPRSRSRGGRAPPPPRRPGSAPRGDARSRRRPARARRGRRRPRGSPAPRRAAVRGATGGRRTSARSSARTRRKSARARSSWVTITMRGTPASLRRRPHRSASRAVTPSTALTTTAATSATARAVSTPPTKSGCPGVSMSVISLSAPSGRFHVR